MGHYHDTVPFATTNFATAAKRNASACNIERHPLRDTASHPRPLGVARLAMAYPTLRSSTFRSAPLFGSGDQGPLLSSVSIWLAGFRLTRRNPKNASIRCEAYAALRRR